MARGRKTGERQKGARNRATEEARAAAEATGILPLDYMLMVMRDASADHKRRDAMAMAAAPYLHPKLSSVDAKLSSASEKPEVDHIQVTFVHAQPQGIDEDAGGKLASMGCQRATRTESPLGDLRGFPRAMRAGLAKSKCVLSCPSRRVAAILKAAADARRARWRDFRAGGCLPYPPGDCARR